MYINPSDFCGGSCKAVDEFMIMSIRSSVAPAKSQDPPEWFEGFLLLDFPMRHVDGWEWDTLLHEQAKAGKVGESLEPGGSISLG